MYLIMSNVPKIWMKIFLSVFRSISPFSFLAAENTTENLFKQICSSKKMVEIDINDSILKSIFQFLVVKCTGCLSNLFSSSRSYLKQTI